ncbi:MAG TPA: xanthine dehydrogenase family protein molybdopterin-binding subunit [Candidatus Sulfomarinibacteraceae bacterium]|nr:xanthine dehydrogenase family protein molybdopterin-binding subunit [Candidatus Sulfomarinibacteraceae bacterium]
MSDFAVIGTSPKRIDGIEKVTGRARYAADVHLPGLLFGKIKRSTVAHANIASIDTSKALALPGVKAVLTHENVPRVLHAGQPHPRSSSVWKDQYIFDRRVRFMGEGVAVVAAVSEEIAEEALDLIEVEYDPLPAVFDVEEAMQPDAPQIHGAECNLVLPPHIVDWGDVEKGFEEADFIVEGVYSTGRPSPSYMEPNACVCKYELDGRLTIWSSTQCAFMVRGILSEVLDIPIHHVRVIVEHMGGGFGAKQDLFQHEFLCALLAKETGRPVKMEYTRKESFLGGRTRHPTKIWLRQGVKNDGTITARQARYITDTGAYGSHGPGVTRVGAQSLTSLYRCPNVYAEGICVYTNTPISGAFRGYGVVQSYFALDTQMDEIAEKLGLDPAEYKMQQAVGDGDLTPSEHTIHGNPLASCIRRAIEESNWHEMRRQTKNQSGRKLRGWGIGTEMHGSSAYPGIKEQSNAIVKMNEDGSVHLLTGTAGLGTGAHTALSQIAAEELGVRFEDVTVTHGDTDVVPFDIGAYASRTTFIGGGAVKRAAADLKKQLLELAADKLEAAAEDLVVRQGQVFVRGAPDQAIAVGDVVKGDEGGITPRSLVASATYETTKAYSYAAHVVEVEVDTETGQVEVKQVIAVHEIGKAINPIGVEGQIEGGIQQGIGHSLTEDLVIDPETGRALNASFVDYKMPLSMDMPTIKPIILEEAPDGDGPFGAKGVGEDPIIAIGPAIGNAVYDALGVRIRELPITPDKVLRALRQQASTDDTSNSDSGEE